MRAPADAPTRDKVLFLLKTKGPQTAAALADRLDVTSMAARQHLQKLADDGLVTWHDERQKIGRPQRIWRLTEAGSARFPDNHSDLTVELLTAVRATFGEQGLDKLVCERTKSQLARYRTAIDSHAPLAERVAALCRQRTAEGYMAESRRCRDGSVTLVENHCPICAAAAACQGFCAQELALFCQVLGKSVKVERTEHILEGARRCAYRISETR